MAKRPVHPSETAEIYGLIDPRDGKMRYLGKAVCAHKRLKSHLREARRRASPVHLWIRELVSLGMLPVVRVLETCPIELWQVRERTWIRTAYEMGGILLNQAPGGNEPYCPHDVRVANAKKVCAIRVSTPEKAEFWLLKKTIGANLAAGVTTEKTKALLREAAQLAPHLFGEWANL